MIHTFKMHGTNIAVDVYSGAVHVLDDIAFDAIGCYDENGSLDRPKLANLIKYNKKEVEEAVSEIECLKNRNLLFTKDPYTDYIPSWTKNTVVKALCLHIAHDCNLRCKYCFAGTGEYLGQRSLMSREVGEKAIDFLIENSGNRRNLEVDFFGGEPLMNFDVVKDIVVYARQREQKENKNFRFTITTNVLLLDEKKRAFINENKHTVVHSFDE